MLPKSGDLIENRFEITGQIGSGGMGAVFSANDLKLNRPVAIKVLHTDTADQDEQEARLRREVKALSQFDHKNVVKVYAFGVWRESEMYIAMELLEGESLASLLSRKGRLSEIEAIEILRPVTEALAAVHSLGIVHRDLKPHNIFLAHEGNATTIKLLDFGLCKPTLTSDERLTGTGLLIGSVHYMSPEASMGRATSAQSDIYALGIILYEMLTGEPPFTSDSPVGVIFKQANTPVPLLSATDPHLPHFAAFDRFLAKCMAKDLQQRYKSCGDVLADIERLKAVATSPRVDLSEIISIGSDPLGQPNARKFGRAEFWIAGALIATISTVGITVINSRSGGNSQMPIESVSWRQLDRSLKLLQKNKDNPQSVETALRSISEWLKSPHPEGERMRALTAKAEWLRFSQRTSDNTEGEALLERLLKDVSGKDDLLELTIRTKLAQIYNLEDKNKDLIRVTEPMYKIWKRHEQSLDHTEAAYTGIRMRGNGCALMCDQKAAEQAHLELMELVESEMYRVPRGTGLFVEDNCEVVEFYLKINQYDKALRRARRGAEIAESMPEGTYQKEFYIEETHKLLKKVKQLADSRL